MRLSGERAADLVWAIASPETYDLLVLQRGWSPADFAAWVADAIAAALSAGALATAAEGQCFPWADADDRIAAHRLADLLFQRGDLAGLRALAEADDGWAARRLASLLADRGDLYRRGDRAARRRRRPGRARRRRALPVGAPGPA